MTDADVINLYERRDWDDAEGAEGAQDPSQPDPEAPFGRKPDGTPYKVSAEVRRRLAQGRVQAAQKRRSSPAGAGRTKAKRSTQGMTRRQALLGSLQLIAAGLASAGALMPTLALDGLAVQMHAEPIATAVDELAESSPAVATALDRIARVGPYGGLVMAITPLVLQIAANHRMIPPIPDFGIQAPEDLLATEVSGDGQAVGA